MDDTDVMILELDKRIAATRDNIRQLVEQAAAVTGIAAEEAAADRMAEQEAVLAELIKARDNLTGGKP
ncbi:hypothetical protein [Phreatobacter stygius]|uniref:Uncharacterized protein n=1 Tax=Phreatobacter stygius TaxID=1940610 RepID=A0A4D7B689_9HYPH|nr:hypothetical protein [Phreatobacter stygius]QCI68521.1 hypothetical protein E8M01_32415 [Phreatobacter stygius]